MSFRGKKTPSIFHHPTASTANKGLGHVGLLFFMGLLSSTLVHHFCVAKAIAQMTQRAQNYLCLRGLVENTSRQLRTQKRWNQAIKGLNVAMALAAIKPMAFKALLKKKKWAIRASQLSFGNYLKKLIELKCPSWPGLHALNTPFKRKGLLLQRSAMGYSMAKDRWKFFISGKKFILHGTLQDREKLRWNIYETKRAFF